MLQDDLDAEQTVLEQAEAQARAQLREVQDGQAQLQQVVAEQQQVLQQVQGELAQLVAEEEARRRAEEERLARERYQAQLAAEQARAAQQAEARRQAAAAQEQARREAAAAQEQARREAAARTTTAPTAAAPADERDAAPAPTAPPTAPARPSGPTATGGTGTGSAVVEAARKYLGIPYRYGGSGPNDFDCSGLTAYVYREFGVSMPHSAEWQYNQFPHVSRDELQAGDLVFFGSPIHHVGIYVGNGQMLDAPHTGTVVQVRTMLRRDYVGAARPAI